MMLYSMPWRKKNYTKLYLFLDHVWWKKGNKRRFQSAFLINHSFLGMEIISTSFHKSLEYMFVFLSFLKDREVECWNINARVNRKFVHRMKHSIEKPNFDLGEFRTQGGTSSLFKLKERLGLDDRTSNWSDRSRELYSTYSSVNICPFLGFFSCTNSRLQQ